MPKRKLSVFFKPQKKPDDAAVRSAFENLDMGNLKKNIIFVQANAGGGKTHSVIQFIKKHRHMRILVMSHTNASVKVINDRVKEGLKRIPPNITIKTYDSFAWHHAHDVLNPTSTKEFNCMSGDRYTHSVLKKVKEEHTTVSEYLSRDSKLVKTSHQLNRHVLLENRVQKIYDIVIVDEAQDLCPLARKFLETSNEIAKYKIFVGDEKQCIYHPECIFTKNVPDAEQFKFTHVFRYGGEELIDWINHNMPSKSKHTASMAECTTISPRIGFADFAKLHKQTTVLVTQWKYMLHYDMENMYIAKENKENIRKQVKLHRLFGVRQGEYELLANHVKDALDFENWMIDKGYEYLLDYESPKWERVFEKLDLNDANKPDKNKAHHITTVFQMKGLETESVYVDFSCIPYENTSPASNTIKDNLFYVAITRATDHIGLAGLHYPYQPWPKKEEEEPF